MKKIYITALIIAFVGIVFGVKSYLSKDAGPVACTMEAKICPDGSSVGRVGPACEFAECPTTNPPVQNLQADVYPFPSTMSWGTEASSTITLKDQKIIGSEVKSTLQENITDISKVFVPFQQYYSDKLIKAGWIQNKNLAADAAGSSLWVFTKNSQYIVLSYKSDPINKALTSPLTCPCNMAFTVFTGTAAK